MRHVRNLINKNNAWLLQRVNMIPYFPVWGHLYNQNHHHILNNKTLEWQKKPGAYANHIEMSGTKIACIISYGVDKEGYLRLNRHLAFPNLRLKPNHTRSNLRHNSFSTMKMSMNGELVKEKVEGFSFDGILRIETSFNGLTIKRKIYPSMEKCMYIEEIELISDEQVLIDIKEKSKDRTVQAMLCVDGPFYIRKHILNEHLLEQTRKPFILKGRIKLYKIYSADAGQAEVFKLSDTGSRQHFLDHISRRLVLQTPDEQVDALFNFSKIRVCESIYNTSKGFMHSPGGGGYYAAMWTNDQCEYINPLMPFIGYDIGLASCLNCFYLFNTYEKIPSSIISGGASSWNMAGDRGDAAMYLYGLGRFLLAYGDKALARSYIPIMEKRLLEVLNKRNDFGVITSDSDELENRLASGKANLFTSSLVYDALVSSHYIVEDLGVDFKIDCKKEAGALSDAIEAYFGASISDYETYRYYKGNKKLRSWISVPITMNILERASSTIDALFDVLWGPFGIRSVSDRDIYWDRSTLYAFRAAFIAGKADLALMYLKPYVRERLTGHHMPYPIEAYPEGNQKQLSGESGLYARMITEGLFGVRVKALNTFVCKPSMPSTWDHMRLNHMTLFGKKFDLEVLRNGASYTITVYMNNEIYHQTISTQALIRIGD